MKKWITFTFLFCIQCCLVCSAEKDLYLINIEKAFNAYLFEEQIEIENVREEMQELFFRIYEKEKAHPEFIQCVTAADSLFYAYQVIAKELHRRLYGQPREDFEFLRFPTQNLLKNRKDFFSRFPALILSTEELAKEFKTTPNELEKVLRAYEIRDEENFLKISTGEEEKFNEWDRDEEENEETPTRFQINDTVPEVSKELLAVNFTMETYRPLDSALFVFLSGNSVSLSSLSQNSEEYEQKMVKLLCELFDSLSLPQKKVAVCIEKLIEKAPRTKCGIINQIFLPKENVTNCLYLSFGGGFLHSIYDSKFEAIYNEFQSNRQENSFRTFRNFQARIIAGALFEDSKVKIFRHTLIPQETQIQYEAIVRDAIDELLTSVY